MYVLDTDVLIDIQRGHAPALVWFTGLTDLPSVPGLVVMELIQDAQNAQQVRVEIVVGLKSDRPEPQASSRWSMSKARRWVPGLVVVRSTLPGPLQSPG